MHIAQDEASGLYRNYLNIAEFIKYDDAYVGRFHTFWDFVCTNRHHHSNSTMLLSPDSPYLPLPRTRAAVPVPPSGLVKVYSKAPLGEQGNKHLLAASLSLVGGRRILTLCCAEKDEGYGVNVLRELMYRQKCMCLSIVNPAISKFPSL